MVSTHLKNISQIGSFLRIGLKIKNIQNHHLVTYWFPVFFPKNRCLVLHNGLEFFEVNAAVTRGVGLCQRLKKIHGLDSNSPPSVTVFLWDFFGDPYNNDVLHVFWSHQNKTWSKLGNTLEFLPFSLLCLVSSLDFFFLQNFCRFQIFLKKREPAKWMFEKMALENKKKHPDSIGHRWIGGPRGVTNFLNGPVAVGSSSLQPKFLMGSSKSPMKK